MEPSQDYTDFVHTGPGTLAGRYLRMFWQPVFRVKDLAPRQAVPVKLMGESFTLFRGEGGTPYLVDFTVLIGGPSCPRVGWKVNPFAAVTMGGNTMGRANAWNSQGRMKPMPAR